MAISHCSVRRGRAGKGASHAQYVLGEGRYGRDDVEHVEHGNMPAFAAADPLAFWQAADAYERANGRAYTEIQYAVPRELTERKDQLRFAHRMADGIVGVMHPFTLAMHDSKAADGGRNVHVHLMFSERQLDGIERGPEQFFKRAAAPYRHRVTKEMMPADPARGGTAKNRAMNAKGFVTKVRQRYEQTVNQALERAGIAERITMTRNDLMEPEPKLGPMHGRAAQDERRAARLDEVRKLREARAGLKALVVETQEAIKSEIDLTTDLTAALAERTAMRAKAAAKAEREVMQAKAAERLAAFRASGGKAPERPVPAAPATPSVEELTAQSYAGVLHGLQALDERWTASAASIERGMYAGRVLLVTDFHVAQDAGRHQAAVHERARLDGDVKEGDRIIIQYASGRGKVRPERDQQRHRGRGL